MRKLADFLSELKRRRVFRVAIVYAGVAFIIFQIVDATFEPLHLPDWVGTLVVVLLALGFPIAVGLAWAFDITEKGVVRTKAKEEAAPTERPPRPLLGNMTLAIVAALAVAVAVWSWWDRPATSTLDKSIAVLPFANFSDSKEDEYFSDGVTDDIITHLTRIGDLKVISRTSAMLYKDSPKPLRAIAEELGVSNILEGTVRRAGDKVRITSQLIDARTDEHLWAETYDRDLTDIFAVQSDVAQQIAHALQVRISPAQMDRIEKHPTENMEAYTFYLLGRSYWNKRTKEGLEKAIEYFSRAIAEDSSYALAYTGLADCYSLLPFYGSWFPKEAYPRAMAAAVKALELDDKLAEAHTSLAGVKAWLEWDFSAAEREFKRAIQLNPGYATSHFWCGLLMAYMGRLDEGLTEVRRALELDPLSPIINNNIGIILYWQRRYDEAIDQFHKTIEIDTEFRVAHNDLGKAYLQKGMFEASIEELRKSGSPELAYAYAALGRRDEAQAVLEGLEKRSTLERVDPVSFAKAYLGLGETDQALEALERAYEERSLRLLDEIYNDPYYDSLRSDPRYTAILKKMGLEP